VARTNELIRALAREEGALLVDLHAAFQRSADPSSLFSDHVHPNDDGYDVIATAYFEALTRPRGSGAAVAGGPGPSLGFARLPAR
jgi:lysophospholipase L1-like esterase